MKNLLNLLTKKPLSTDHADAAVTRFIIVMIGGFAMLIFLMLSNMAHF